MRHIRTIIAWAATRLTYMWPSMFYVQVWPRERNRPIGPLNIGGTRWHPRWLDWVMRKSGMKTGFGRSSSFQ